MHTFQLKKLSSPLEFTPKKASIGAKENSFQFALDSESAFSETEMANSFATTDCFSFDKNNPFGTDNRFPQIAWRKSAVSPTAVDSYHSGNCVQKQASLQTVACKNNPNQMHQAAKQGICGEGSRLPHFETLQEAFGQYDISHVRAYTDTNARVASEALGAKAYTSGNKIAFAEHHPDLFTTAHEAAHVIQQQAGVHLKGGIGEVGDWYEQHADAVANQVVQGRSAEMLLHRSISRRSKSTSNVNGNRSQPSGVSKPIQLATVAKPADPSMSKTEIDFIPTASKELIPDPVNKGSKIKTTIASKKTTELSALLIPTDPTKLDSGKKTQSNVSPPGWNWIELTERQEITTKNSKKKIKRVMNWVKFHLLNHQVGGRGDLPEHLVPAGSKANSNWSSQLEEPLKDALAARMTKGGMYVYLLRLRKR